MGRTAATDARQLDPFLDRRAARPHPGDAPAHVRAKGGGHSRRLKPQALSSRLGRPGPLRGFHVELIRSASRTRAPASQVRGDGSRSSSEAPTGPQHAAPESSHCGPQERVPKRFGARCGSDLPRMRRCRRVEKRGGRPPIVNEGIPASRIVAHVQTQVDGVTEEGAGLLEGFFDAAPPADPEAEPIEPMVTSHGLGTGAHAHAVPGGATWSIPLTLSVSVREGSLVAQPPARSLVADLELFKKDLDSAKSLLRGLTFLEEARERPYLPEAGEMQRRRDEYYGDLPQRVENGQISPEDLYDELNALQQETLSIVTEFPKPLEVLESLAGVRLESGVVLESAGGRKSAMATGCNEVVFLAAHVHQTTTADEAPFTKLH